MKKVVEIMNSNIEGDGSSLSGHQYTSQSFSDGNMTRLDAMRKHNAFRMRQQEIKAKLAKDSDLQRELGVKLQQNDSIDCPIHEEMTTGSEGNHISGISNPIEVNEKEEIGNAADIFESGISNNCHATQCINVSDTDSDDGKGREIDGVVTKSNAVIINEDNVNKSLPAETPEIPVAPKTSRQPMLSENIKRPSPRLSPQNHPNDVGRLRREHYLGNVPEENTIEAMLNRKQRQRELTEAFLKAEMTEYVR